MMNCGDTSYYSADEKREIIKRLDKIHQKLELDEFPVGINISKGFLQPIGYVKGCLNITGFSEKQVKDFEDGLNFCRENRTYDAIMILANFIKNNGYNEFEPVSSLEKMIIKNLLTGIKSTIKI